MVESTPEFDTLRARIATVRNRIETAALHAGRSADEIALIAISKTHPAEILKLAITLGVTDLGENRVQEADEKVTEVGRNAARWHLVGHLQANKARRAVNLFDCIHSIDSPDIARRLDRLCQEEGREKLDILVQVDLGGEASKTGIDPRALPELLAAIGKCRQLRLIGLMTLPPYFENPDCARPFFKTLRELRDELKPQGHFGDGPGALSMGMTHDFEIAIEEGATMLRIGTAIFGERS